MKPCVKVKISLLLPHNLPFLCLLWDAEAENPGTRPGVCSGPLWPVLCWPWPLKPVPWAQLRPGLCLKDLHR